MSTNIKISDLVKTLPSNHPDYPKLRYTKIVDKIKLGEPFSLLSGSTRLDYASAEIKKAFEAGDIESLKRKQNLFVELGKKKNVKVTDIKKSEISSGVSLGSEKTDLVESAQCLFCSLVFNVYNKQIKTDHLILPSDIEKAMAYVDTSVKVNKTVFDLPDDWIDSSIVVANKLFQKYGSVATKYTFHHQSSTVKKIEQAFKKVNQKERAFGNINKWSPADIYMAASMVNLTQLLKEKTLKGLNGELLTHFNKKTFIGVSLKKVGSSATLKSVNVNKSKGATGASIGRKKLIIRSPGGSIYDSMDTYVQWGNSPIEKIQFRTFATDAAGLSSWQGELKGEIANHGKIGSKALSYIVKTHLGKELPKPSLVAQRVKDADDSLCEEIYNMTKFLIGSQNLPSLDMHMKLCYENEPKWRYSKYQGLKIASILKRANRNDADQAIADFYYYAGSATTVSAPHLKIQ